MPFVTIPDGTQLYYEEEGEGDPLLLVSGQRQDHTFGMGFAAIFRITIASLFTITGEPGRATSQSLRLIQLEGSRAMPWRCSTTLVCPVPTYTGIPWAEGSANGWALIMENGLGQSS